MTQPLPRARAIATCTCTTRRARSRRAPRSSHRTRPGRRTGGAARARPVARGAGAAHRLRPRQHVLLDALGGPAPLARGVVVLPADVADAELQRLHAARRARRALHDAGRRGRICRGRRCRRWRCASRRSAGTSTCSSTGALLPSTRQMIDALPCGVVIDHTGKFIEPVPVGDHERSARCCRCSRRPQRWVKLSAPYGLQGRAAALRRRVGAGARPLLRPQPERCLWASDWPHPIASRCRPTTRGAGACSTWIAGDRALATACSPTNPAALYGF